MKIELNNRKYLCRGLCSLGHWLLCSLILGVINLLSFQLAFAEHVPHRVLVKFRASEHARAPQLLARIHGKVSKILPKTDIKVVELPARASERSALSFLRRQREVDFAELDNLYAPSAVPNDPRYSSQWHLPKISSASAWDLQQGSDTVIIAIIDTGVDGTHPDLAAKIVPGWNFYDNNSDTADVYGHGTAVAGTATAIGNNAVGVTGACWNCKLMPIRISDPQGYGSTSRIANALTWSADRGARVANISYRVSTSSAVKTAAQYFSDHGGVVTVSAGNEGDFDIAANNPYVLTVGATTSSDSLASWSVTGNLIDLVAPGTSILTTNRGGSYGSWSGTSFSAPLVAGVAGLIISANPSLTGLAAQDIIMATVDDLGTAGWDTTYGFGRLNSAKAVSQAAQGSVINPSPTPAPTPSPADLAAPIALIDSPTNGTRVLDRLTINASASDDVAVVRLELYIDGSLKVSASGATLTMNWNTRRIALGAHTIQSVAYDAAGNLGRSEIVTVYK